MTDFIFWAPKSLQPWNLKMFAPWKESCEKPRQCIKKQRHHFVDKGSCNQSYGFSSSHVWIWDLDHKEGWVSKSWCFELCCWRRFLWAPWTARRSSQSILKETSPEHSLEGLVLKLKLWYFGHLMHSANSLEESLMLGKIEGKRRRGRQRMRQLDSITDQWTWISATSRR